MQQSSRTSIAAAFVLVILASTVVVGIPANAVAQTDEPRENNSAASVAQRTDASGSWSIYRADGGRAGATTADGPRPFGNGTWQRSYPGLPTGGPAVVDGTAYLGVETRQGKYRQVGGVTAYDAASGDVRWNRTGLGSPAGSPTVVDDTVFVATSARVPSLERHDTADGDGGLYALDAETGRTEWARNGSEKWSSAPVYEDGRLFAVRGPESLDVENRTTDRTVTGDSSLVALDPETGETTWSVAADGLIGVANGTVVATDDGRLVAYDSDTHDRLWGTERPSGNGVRYAITDEALYAVERTSDGVVRAHALAVTDGSALWNVTVSDDSDNVYRPAVADGGVFVTVGNGSDASSLVRLDASTGDEAWRFERTGGDLSGGPTVANDTVFVGGSAESGAYETSSLDRPGAAVVAVTARDGSRRWSATTGSDLGTYATALAPSVADGALYVPSYNAKQPPRQSTGQLGAVESSTASGGDEDDGPTAVVSRSRRSDAEYGENETAVLDAHLSSAGDGSVAVYEWDLDDDGTYERTGEETTVTLEPCEVATVTLRVTTDDGGTATNTVVISNG